MFKSYCVFGRKALYSAILALSFLLLAGEPVLAELPRLPELALVPQSFRTMLTEGNQTFYPDGRIWATRSPLNGPKRRILVPVLIQNTWVTDPGLPQYQARPIHSFEFAVQYDDRALTAVGVRKLGPMPTDTFSLAKDFLLEWDVAIDLDYKKSLNPSQGDEPNGRRITITGTSAHPMPPSPPENATSHDQREFVELLYIEFEVDVRIGNAFPSQVPLIITNESIMYNDMSVLEMQFQEGYNPPAPNEPVPGEYAGLHGIDNEGRLPEVTEPTRPGVVYVSFADPGLFEFEPTTTFQAVPNTNGSEWEVVLPMTIEKFQIDPDNVARLSGFVFNGVANTRITNIKVESDAPWLFFDTQGDKDPCDGPTQECEIDFLDNGILEQVDPLGNELDPDPKVQFEIIADPNAVGQDSPYYDGAGIYVGYITFSSESAGVTPVRLKVTFIVYRNPLEPLDPSEYEQQNEFVNGTGIRLRLENSRTPAQNTEVIFGTGIGASVEVDQLFAEAEYENPLGANFGARWFPRREEDTSLVVPNGLKDLTGRSTSRDIRSAEGRTTHTYYLGFEAGSEENYPVVVSWSTDDFPEGSRLFIRDREGNIFADMREATPVPGQPNRRAITVTDARVKELIIEYSPATVQEFPLVQKGWNLVSLPVRPGDREYREIFPNALEAPRFFSANDYFQEPDGQLRFGIGYFVKYGNILDTKLAGVPVYEIGANTPYRILLREGWNTIGALSCPVRVEDVRFDAYNNQPLPRRVSGVYRYVTDRGYEEVSVLEPGIGYWVKIEGDGYLNMKTQPGCLGKVGATELVDREAAIAVSDRLTIRDNSLREGTLYVATNADIAANRFALPPVPPAGMFDVRFISGRYIDNAAEPVVEIRGAEYPVVLSIENADVSYTVVDAVTGAVLGTFEQGKAGSVEITNPKTFAVKLLKSNVAGEAYSLEQNMPNPFSGVTAINFTLPQQELVTIKLYNMMGQEVATLFNGVKPAGFNSIVFDAAELTSGTYTYTITAGSYTATRRMVVVK